MSISRWNSEDNKGNARLPYCWVGRGGGANYNSNGDSGKDIEGSRILCESRKSYYPLWAIQNWNIFEIKGSLLSITIYSQDLTNGFYWRKIFIAPPQCSYQIRHCRIVRAIAKSRKRQDSHSEPPKKVIINVVAVWIHQRSQQLQEVMYMNLNRKVNLYFHFMIPDFQIFSYIK